MAPFDRPYTTFYWSASVNIDLSGTDFKVFDVEWYHDLEITGSALALHCCKAHAKINRKFDPPPCKIVTHGYFNLKLGTRDYVVDINHHASFGSKRFSRGFSPNRGNISLFVTFFVILPFCRSRAHVEPSHWFLRWMAQTTCFQPRTVLLGVGTMGDVIWGKYAPKTLQ